MATTVQLKQVETPHDNATVCDFDELPDSAQDDVASAARSNSTEILTHCDASQIFDVCDVVRFTAYYRVTASSA